MNKSTTITVKHFIAKLTCTLLVVLGMLVAFSREGQAQTSDTTAPTVSIGSPASGTTYTSAQTVTITASAKDNVGVAKVQFFDGTTWKGTDTTYPYSYSWPITSADNGSHSFTAKAYDAAGKTKVSSAVVLTVKIGAADTTAPTVSISSPASGTTYTSAQTVSFAVAAQDNVGVSKVELYDGSTLVGTDTASPFAFSFAFTSAHNGSHSFTAKAYDAAGNSKVSSAVALTVNIGTAATTASTVSISSPSSGTTYTSAQTVTINASVPAGADVKKVQFFDGTTWKGTDTTYPYSYSWPITSADNGSHNFTAKSYDSAGKTKVSSVVALNVNIGAADTTAPTVSISSPSSGTTYTSAQTVSFAVAAQDNIGVSKVELYEGSALVGTDTAAPYAFSLALTSANNGSYSFTAKAYDAAGNSKVSSPTALTVNIGASATPAPAIPAGAVKAFPGAKGFGSDTKAGRGGQIVKVTNLNDSGAGSLRAAVEASGPRTIVFEVSGRINLLSNLSIKNPYVTIAGQSAPAPGIMITGRTLVVTTHDVLVQHVSIRVGDEDKLDDSGRTADSIQITGTGAYNIVFDHVSASWAIDEIVGIGYGIKDITFNNCFFAEGLNQSVHPKGAHGYGFLLGDDSTRISLIGNLMAHAADRLPRVQGGDFLLVNNVFYNKGGTNFSAIGSNASIATRMSAVGNLFLEGLDGSPGKAIAENSTTTAAGSAIYQKDNAYPGGTIFGGSHGVSSPPAAAWISGLSYMTDPVNQVKASVLKNAGSRPAFRDAVDKRVATDVANKTGRIIDSQRDVGGFPVLAQNKATFNAGTNPNGDDNGNGYTNLEEILYQMALQVEGR